MSAEELLELLRSRPPRVLNDLLVRRHSGHAWGQDAGSWAAAMMRRWALRRGASRRAYSMAVGVRGRAVRSYDDRAGGCHIALLSAGATRRGPLRLQTVP
jgi:hypothetical protein